MNIISTTPESDIVVIKSDGTQEDWNPDKIYKHIKWACSGTNISPSQIMMDLNIKLSKKMKTSEIHDTVIKSVADSITETEPDNQIVAARLLNQKLRKQVFGGWEPRKFSECINEGIKKKYYDDNILKYSADEIEELSNYIDHSRDDLFTYTGLLQTSKKLLLRDKQGQNLESPQEAFMLISMYMFLEDTDRISRIKQFYDGLSKLELILSTPISVGVRTNLRMYSSCAGIMIGDNYHAIGQAFKDAYTLTINRAGVGINPGHIRGLGASIANGRETHTGIVPILKVAEKISISAVQPGSGRGGAITNYYPFYHAEIMTLLELKNNKGTEDNRVRQSDHCIIFNNFFMKRFNNNEDITLFYGNDTGDLYESIGKDDFESKYLELEAKRNIKKTKVPAREIYKKFWLERFATGRMYKLNANEFQSHSAFKIPVYNSNLCLDGSTEVKTKNGIKLIKDIVPGDFVLSYNTDTGRDEYKEVTASALMNNSAEVLEIEDEQGNILVCTQDHLIYTLNRGYVKAGNLKSSDILKKSVLKGGKWSEEQREKFTNTIKARNDTN